MSGGWGGNKGSAMLGVSHPHPTSGTPIPMEDFRQDFCQVGKSSGVQRDLDLLSASGMVGPGPGGGNGRVLEGSNIMNQPAGE